MELALMHEAILLHVQKHISLSVDEAQLFISLLNPRKLLRRQFLVQADDVCKYESFVVQGCLRSFYIDASGEEHVLHFAVEDWWTSDTKSFLHQTPAQIHIEALEPTLVLQIDKPGLDQLYEDIPAFERFFRILHQNAYIAQTQRILNNISLPAKERYEAFLESYPHIARRVPLKHLASYLGITPVFLSQIRRQMSVDPPTKN